jgi:uncharacterized protein
MLPLGGRDRMRYGFRTLEMKGNIGLMNEIDRKSSGARSCPLCGKTVDEAFKPFCSKRCADIDLNRWLSGVYAVPVKEEESEDSERPADGDTDEHS